MPVGSLLSPVGTPKIYPDFAKHLLEAKSCPFQNHNFRSKRIKISWRKVSFCPCCSHYTWRSCSCIVTAPNHRLNTTMPITTNVLKPFTFTKRTLCCRPRLPGKPWEEGDLLLPRVSLTPGVRESTSRIWRVGQMFIVGLLAVV